MNFVVEYKINLKILLNKYCTREDFFLRDPKLDLASMCHLFHGYFIDRRKKEEKSFVFYNNLINSLSGYNMCEYLIVEIRFNIFFSYILSKQFKWLNKFLYRLWKYFHDYCNCEAVNSWIYFVCFSQQLNHFIPSETEFTFCVKLDCFWMYLASQLNTWMAFFRHVLLLFVLLHELLKEI